MEKIFKALSDQNRLKILNYIYENSCKCKICKCEDCGLNPTDFQKALNVSFPTITHHLDILEKSGLITRKRDGQNINCKINYRIFDKIQKFLDKYNI